MAKSKDEIIAQLADRISPLIEHAAKQSPERRRLNSEQIAHAAYTDVHSYFWAVYHANECPKCPRHAATRPAGDGRLGLMECCTCGHSWKPGV